MRKITITAGTGFTASGVRLQPCDIIYGVRKARKLLAETFGGYTETCTNGGWWDGSALVEEAGRQWVALTAGMSAELAEWKAREAGRLIAQAFNQECVVVEVAAVNAAFVNAVDVDPAATRAA